MTASEVIYTLDNTWEKAHRRLTVLELLGDRWTIPRLTALGVGPGWRCLELGAGAGSIARWLCDWVGPTGTVTAVDLEPRFLEADPRPNMEILRHDIVADGVPGDGWDLIHARALLMHLPNRDELIGDLVSRLRPGGAILLEEGDCYPCDTSESPAFRAIWRACQSMAEKAGGDWTWAHLLPARLASAGAAGVATTVDSESFRGGTLWAELFSLSFEQVAPLLVAEGLPADLIDTVIADLADPGNWFPSPAIVAAWGHRPS